MLGIKLLFAGLCIATVFTFVAIGGMLGLYGPGSPLDWALYRVSECAIVLTVVLLAAGVASSIIETK